jgi:hypothetical protein
MVMISLYNQETAEESEQGFASPAGVVDDCKKVGQRADNPPRCRSAGATRSAIMIKSLPAYSYQRRMISSSEGLAFHRIPSGMMEVISRRWYHVDLTKAATILIWSIFPATMAHRLVLVALGFQASINGILFRVNA